ncbi:MAG: hypothetical protein ABSB71_11500 [Candidatus Bathyarchaeia archaeon]
MKSLKWVSFGLIILVFTFLAVGLTYGKSTPSTSLENSPSPNDTIATTSPNTTTSTTTSTTTTFTDSSGTPHHAYYVTAQLSTKMSISTASSISTTFTLPTYNPSDSLESPNNSFLNYFNLTSATVILGTIASGLIYLKVPNPVKRQRQTKCSSYFNQNSGPEGTKIFKKRKRVRRSALCSRLRARSALPNECAKAKRYAT